MANKKNKVGRKLKYGERTVIVSFRLPKSKINEVKYKINNLLEKWKKKQLR